MDGTLLPDEEDCTSFYQCSNGVAVKTSCPGGLEFNPDQLVCDFPELAGCNGEGKGRYFPTVRSCTVYTTYYDSLSGQYYISERSGTETVCPPGTSKCTHEDCH
ncbi:carbohydrate-binding module family 14 protein [Flavobacterium sharifuzzamanii]|uniref:carbohydrate-binding module family 14 protein n=1 Tax=Flavobacterium sharifuzzamanii TaxID=2211133 RepID=UPI0037434F71